MSANRSKRSSPNIVPTTCKLELTIQRAKWMHKPSFQIVRERIKVATTEGAGRTLVWTAVLNEESNNIDENEELEDELELFDEMKVAMDVLVTRCAVIALIVDRKKNATAATVM